MGRLSQEELYGYAEKLLGKQICWEQLHHLDDEDQGRLKALVDRGPRALAEGQGKLRLKKQQRVPGGRTPHQLVQTVFVPLERVKADFTTLIQHLPLTPFPIGELFKQEEELQTRWIAYLFRDLREDLLMHFFAQLPLEQREALMEKLGPRATHILEEGEEQESESPEVDNASRIHCSLATLRFLREEKELSQELQEVTDEYSDQLEQEILDYYKQLPHSLGIIDIIEDFTDTQWQRLAGITPRLEMAQLATVLDPKFFKKLTAPLPQRQLKELEIDIDLCHKNRRKDIQRCAAVIEAVRNWARLVDKVQQIDRI